MTRGKRRIERNRALLFVKRTHRIDPDIADAAGLTRFAVATRYPGVSELVTTLERG